MSTKADKLRVVCDTNVLLSMLGFPGGRLDALWEIIQDGRIDLFLSEFILECAVEAKAQVLVTGNFKHIVPLKSFRGIAILTPREFLDKYFPL